MERDGGDLETEADGEQADREQRQRAVRARGDRRADDVEPGGAGDDEGEGDAVEEERAREGAEQEILERGLGPRDARSAQAGQDVDRQRQHFERQEDDQQVGGRRHQHHPADREERQRVVLARRQPFPLHDVVRKHHRDDADDAEDDVDEEGEVVGADDAEADGVGVPQEARRDQGADEPDEAEAGDVHPLARMPDGLGQHRGDGREHDDQDRDGGGERAHRATSRREAEARGAPGGRQGSGFPRLAPPTSRLDSADATRTPLILSSIRTIDGSIGLRNTPGATPMKMQRATVGTIKAHSRGDRSGSFRFFSWVTSP